MQNCVNVSNKKIERRRNAQESFEEAPLWAAIITYLGYGILNIFGWVRDFLRAFGMEKNSSAKDPNPDVGLF